MDLLTFTMHGTGASPFGSDVRLVELGAGLCESQRSAVDVDRVPAGQVVSVCMLICRTVPRGLSCGALYSTYSYYSSSMGLMATNEASAKDV